MKFNKKFLIMVCIIIVIVVLLKLDGTRKNQTSFRVGWISDLSGPQKKYGTYEAGKLALEQINAKGGINGKPLEIIFEDGKCNGAQAVSAMNKLISIDKVDIVIGGHCTSESAAIAPIANKNKILMLASITSSPVLSDSGPYVFRTSPVSTVQSDIVSDLAFKKLNLKNFAVIYELTDYAKAIAETFKDDFIKAGGKVSIFEGYAPGTNDFRTILQKTDAEGVEGIFLVPQSPDAGLNLVKQISEMGINAQLFGNEAEISQTNITANPNFYEGMISTMPDFDIINNPKSKLFNDEYNARWNTGNLPYGIWTAESYDAVYIIAEGLKKYGDNVEELKKYLETLSYEGASGSISINEHHDGVKTYSLRIVRNGKIEKYQP
ncbi:MAG: ABC transporter substrate-binding protein [Candidatus Taylorbacteria bacterium]|nr:ABC transporter substrate-binding protein [Candidatus Taylorbacteria bacterium]